MLRCFILLITLLLTLAGEPDTTKVKKEVKKVDLKKELKQQQTLSAKLDSIIKSDTTKKIK